MCATLVTMNPSFHPQLVNGPSGDPALYVDTLFARRALLFDLGDIAALAGRKLLRISDVFISHTHMDHWIGFDQLLRVCVGRAKTLRLYGPAGFIDQLGHRLGGYSWNLVENYEAELVLIATEVLSESQARRARFRCRAGFRRVDEGDLALEAGELLTEPAFSVRCTLLDHKIPCLAFALEEMQHVNVWKSRLQERGLPVGPWLNDLKQAVLNGKPQDTPIRIAWRDGEVEHERTLPLAELTRDLLRLVPGQKIAYVVDAGYTPRNIDKIVALTQGADMLYIEAPFLHQDAAHAAARYHLTAQQAGTLARLACVQRLVPFHFSPRYDDAEQRLTAEVEAAFRG